MKERESSAKTDILMDELKKHFAPEFLNRLDDVVIFKSLTKEEIGEIVDLEIVKLKDRVEEIYFSEVQSVKASLHQEEVASIMQKYDLFVVPVVDDMDRLIGQITLDDVVDVIREEADKDYQMAAGITDDVEADDGIVQLTKARLPWLVLALFGGFVSVLRKSKPFSFGIFKSRKIKSIWLLFKYSMASKAS